MPTEETAIIIEPATEEALIDDDTWERSQKVKKRKKKRKTHLLRDDFPQPVSDSGPARQPDVIERFQFENFNDDPDDGNYLITEQSMSFTATPSCDKLSQRASCPVPTFKSIVPDTSCFVCANIRQRVFADNVVSGVSGDSDITTRDIVFGQLLKRSI